MVVDPIPTENRQTRKVGWRAVGVAAFALGLLLQTVPAGALGRSISISSPPPGDLVNGPVPIVVDALGTDVDWINVTVDDDYIGSSPPYTFTWDSTGYASGMHRITAIAYSPSGQVSGWAVRWVRVSNPAVSVIVPSTGTIVAGTVNIVTKVSHEVDWINLYVDGNYVSSPDYAFNLDTTAFPDGPHTIAVEALSNPDHSLFTSAILLNFANNSPTRVLFAGGYSSATILASSETYDPVARIFSNAANMVMGRSSHTATWMLNGQVLLAGGFNSEDDLTGTAELYDPASQTFIATGALAGPRVSHTATLLADGRVLIAGGTSGGPNLVAAAELYDPSIGGFTSTGNLNTPRRGHAAILLPNHSVLLAGGLDGLRTTLSSAELYDPAVGGFTAIGNMLSPRIGHSLTVLANGQVLVTGGAGRLAELFDPGLNSFDAAGEMTVARQTQTATLLASGKVLIAGGYDDRFTKLSSAELYDPNTGSFSPTGNMTAPRAGHTAILLADGSVLIAGGGPNNAETYDPDSGTFIAAGSPDSQPTGGNSATLVY
jgi:hypothetical protein